MKKNIFTIALSAFAALGPMQAALAQERVVNVYNWSDYIDPTILEDFTKETGIKVVYDVFDSNEVLETKLLAGNSGYDIVVPTANFLQRQIGAGVFQKLDKSKLPNISNMWDVINQRTNIYDPGNQYAVDYTWGTVGIGYNVEKMKEITGSDAKPDWDFIFKPDMAAKFKDCGIHMLDSPTDVIPPALHYLGFDPASKNPDELAKVEQLLLSIRPHIRKFHSSEYISALASGDICMAIGWSGDVFQARDRAAEAEAKFTIHYVIPAQGTLMWFDMMAIPADAQHVAEAHEFINYMMRPDIAAKATNFILFPSGNKAAQALIKKEILEDPAIYPPEDVLKKLFTVKAYDAKTQRLITRMWTRIVTGQ